MPSIICMLWLQSGYVLSKVCGFTFTVEANFCLFRIGSRRISLPAADPDLPNAACEGQKRIITRVKGFMLPPT